MKRCPRCNQTFADDSLNFCLNDGTGLVGHAEAPPTVFVPNAVPTAPNQQTYQTPNYSQQQLGSTPQFQRQPVQPRRSSGCLWAIIIVGGLLFLGFIVAVIGLAYLGSTIDDNTNKNGKTSRNLSNSSGIFDDDNKNKAKDSGTDDSEEARVTDDFSGWWTGSDENGTASLTNGEYTVANKKAGNYYIEMSPPRDFNSKYSTKDSIIRVNVKSDSGRKPSLGYGVIVHSNMLLPTFQGYAFIIRSADQSYRVTKHVLRQESIVTSWKKFSGIKTGSESNELEIRTKGDKIDFYINGQLATSTKDTEKFGDGVIGLYTSDAVPVTFSDLRILDDK